MNSSRLQGVFEPLAVLEPPHYDGVTSLCFALNGKALFSGSRDQHLVKWDLNGLDNSQFNDSK